MLLANIFCRAAWNTNRPSPLPRSTNVRRSPRFTRAWMLELCRILSHITLDDRENVGRYGAPLPIMTGGRLSSSPRFATNPMARPALTAGCIWDEVEGSCSPPPASSGLWVLVVADVVLSLDSKSPRPRDDINSFSSRLIVVCWEGIAIVEVWLVGCVRWPLHFGLCFGSPASNLRVESVESSRVE